MCKNHDDHVAGGGGGEDEKDALLRFMLNS